MILLLGMIDRAARDTGVHLSDKQLNKLLKRLRKHADTIGNLSAYLRTAVTNAAALPDPDEPYAATYDIDEYEHTSVIYEDDEN